ncbi:MAG: hypothetical protein J6J82_00460 [Alphaproteobacteria bacterium]|nr:hypothetical protein [Alphaproteobacteria bacterium]
MRHWVQDKDIDMTDRPKILYHGSQHEITDGFIRMRPGHTDGMRTPITATFATPSFRHARLYAAMRIISNGWKWPNGIDTLYVERISPNITKSKAYVYEVSSDGFIPDGDDYYCLNDVPILKTYEIDVMQEIRNGNIKVYVLQDTVDFDGLTEEEGLDLWQKISRTGKFKRYLPEEPNQITAFLNNTMDR